MPKMNNEYYYSIYIKHPQIKNYLKNLNYIDPSVTFKDNGTKP